MVEGAIATSNGEDLILDSRPANTIDLQSSNKF